MLIGVAIRAFFVIQTIENHSVSIGQLNMLMALAALNRGMASGERLTRHLLVSKVIDGKRCLTMAIGTRSRRTAARKLPLMVIAVATGTCGGQTAILDRLGRKVVTDRVYLTSRSVWGEMTRATRGGLMCLP